MGSGYRLVAASRGLRPEEKQHIVTRCPSHEGLCGDDPDAVGVSFYPLPTGRLCVAYTCNAGPEHTGRGGQRIYTLVTVLHADGFDAFGCNPFDVVRALLDAQGHQPQLKPPAVLPTLVLTARFAPDPALLAKSVSQIGPAWVAGILTQLLQQQPIVVLGSFASLPLLEAVVLSLPAPLRARVSFSAGLRYSLNRGFDLAALDDRNPGRLRQMLRGHKVALLEPQAGRTEPFDIDCAWSLMVQRRWQHNRGDALIAFTAQGFPDTSPEALQRYGRLCNRRDQLDQLDPAGLVELLGQHLTECVADELAARLAIGITSDTIARLSDFCSTAPIHELIALWDALVELWQRSESTATLLARLIGSVLMRATRLSPIAAAQMAVRLVRAIQAGAPSEPVQRPINDLLDHLGEWVYDQPPQRASALEPVLQNWGPDGVLASRVRQVQAQIAARLAGSANRQ